MINIPLKHRKIYCCWHRKNWAINKIFEPFSPRLEQIYKYKAYCQEQAQASNSDISSAQETIFSTYPTRGRQNQLLFASETVSIIIILNGNRNCSVSLKVLLYLSIKFSEVRQCCSTHPYNKIHLFTQLF